MKQEIIKQIITETEFVIGEPIEDLRGRLEKIRELIEPYHNVPAYRFTPAPPMDRRKMMLGDDSLSDPLIEEVREVCEKLDKRISELFWTSDDGNNLRDGTPEDTDAPVAFSRAWNDFRQLLARLNPAKTNPTK